MVVWTGSSRYRSGGVLSLRLAQFIRRLFLARRRTVRDERFLDFSKASALIGTMVIGGLGNQMFQYAAARALSLRHASTVTLDLSSFGRQFAVNRSFELDLFRIAVADQSLVSPLRFMLARRNSPLLQKLSGWRPFRETVDGYDSGFEELADYSYLIGYWQSWRYFEDFASIIYDELQPIGPLSKESSQLAEKMAGRTSLSLHVRRGDYVTVPAARNHHGPLDIDHYKRAIRLVQEQAEGIRAFVFSDDLEWCYSAFASLGLDLTFVDCNQGENSWQDMFLMASCRHSIIANSSFSWWGAWLGDHYSQSENRIVIAPRRWFTDKNISFEDRCPPRWIGI